MSERILVQENSLMIKAITFDLDDTLWMVEPVIHKANEALWCWLSIHAPEFTQMFTLGDLAEGSTIRQELLSRHPEIQHSVTLIRQYLLKNCLMKSGYSEHDAIGLAHSAFECFLDARHQVDFLEHADSMLECLAQQNYIIGALSNGNADIKRTALGHRFDFQFNADQVGYAKPHPKMFECALEYTGLQAHEIVHVGDDLDKDVWAAKRMGFKTIWFNVSQGKSSEYVDAEIHSLAQIEGVLYKMLLHHK